MSKVLLSPEAFLKAQAEQRALQDKWSLDRLRLEADAAADPRVRALIVKACQGDPLFWFDHFAWTYDPRPEPGRENVPFIPYDYQRKMILWLWESIKSTRGTAQRKNLLVEKSRDMGASWTMLGFFLWSWLFENGSYLIISRKEEEVDKKGDMDTPFEKLRFMFYRLPEWMRPAGFVERDHDKFLLLKNPEGGDIVGESANRNAGRGGRKLAVLFDEQQAMGNDEAAYRACAQTTNVRISVGTPAGPAGLYYRLANGKEDIAIDKLRLHWSLHPEKGAGVQTIEGAMRSYWYDHQVGTMTPEEIAAELDISYATSVKGLIFSEYTELNKWFPPQVQLMGVKAIFGEEGAPICRVWDPGLTFANMFLQKDSHNRALVLKENITTDASIHDVAQQMEELSQWFERRLKPKRWEDCGDPAGASRQNSAQEAPEYITLRDQYSFDVDYLFMSDMSSKLRVKSRIAAVKNLLQRICAAKKTPYLVVNVKECPTLDEAMAAKYRWKIDRYTKQIFEGRVQEEHPHEDVMDCLGYGVVYWWGVAPLPSRGSREEIYSPPASEIVWDYYGRG